MEEITPPQSRPRLGFRQLEVFHAIMETGSISAASRMLGTTQPSLSRSLQRLEDQLQVELFKRHRKRLVPTSEAKRLFEMVAPAIHQMRAVSDNAVTIADGGASVFRFAVTQSMNRVLVPRAIQAIRKIDPGLRIFLDSVARVEHTGYLLEAQGECIVSLAEIDHPLISFRDIGQMPLLALMRDDNALASRTAIAPDDLRDLPLILFEQRGPHSTAIERFLSGAPRTQDKTYIRFSDAAIGLAAEGVGIALVDGFTAMSWLPPGVVAVPLEKAPLFTARLYWNSERPGSRHVATLGDTLTHLMKDIVHD